MPYKERPIQKVQYSITEVADMFCIESSTLRFWEGEFGKLNSRWGKLFQNARGQGKERYYTPKDLQKVRTIYNLLYTELLTINGAKKRMEEIKLKVW